MHPQLIIQAVVIGASCVAMHFAIKALDPYKEQKAASKKKAIWMKKKLGVSIELNEYEMMLAGSVVNPSEISVGPHDICGMEDLKREIVKKVIYPMQQPRDSHTTLLKPAKGVLLYGPPGTGKTMLAKAMASSCGCFFLTVTSSSILSKYLGDASRMVRAIFSLASKLQPCIIFIDEVDALMGKRGLNGEHEATLQVKTEFMQHWEGLETGEGRVLVMGATNRPQMIDEAILRRFSQQYHVPLPNAVQRASIVLGYLTKHHTETWNPNRLSGGVSEVLLSNSEVALPDGTRVKSLTWVASQTERFSGSDLRELCAQAAQNVIEAPVNANAWHLTQNAPLVLRPIEFADFLAALKSVKPSNHNANDYGGLNSSGGTGLPVNMEDLVRIFQLFGIRPPNGSGGNGENHH